MTLPLWYYSGLIKEGIITDDDIRVALESKDNHLEVGAFLKRVKRFEVDHGILQKTETFIDFIDNAFGQDVNELKTNTISSWASSFFDHGQAIWTSESYGNNDLFGSWKREAVVDRTPDFMGLKGFRKALRDLPLSHGDAIAFVIERFKIPEECVEAFLHASLLRFPGWSSYIAGIDWNNKLYASETTLIEEFLAVLLCWEYAVFKSMDSDQCHRDWLANLKRQEAVPQSEKMSVLDCELILQDAFDIAHQRELNVKFSKGVSANDTPVQVEAQAAFCIDVRSEVIRRNLEYVDPTIETIGFAGFFGVPVKYKPIGHSEWKNQCPVLIPSNVEVTESRDNADVLNKSLNLAKIKNEFSQGVKRFKTLAGSSFGYVSPLGLFYLPKLVADTLKPLDLLKRNGAKDSWAADGKRLDLSGISLKDRISIAASTIKAMGLQDRWAKMVFLIGHGSKSVNNPHSSGLECGACGGHSGEINALTAVEILNDVEVRAGLRDQGVEIPEETLFVAGLHDTISDEITFIGKETLHQAYQEQIEKYKISFSRASKISRMERSRRFDLGDKSSADELMKRGDDWSQVRPEWGLAGCSSFIVAPRNRTKHINLKGRSFLHDYDWTTDDGFEILESILTAPMVVTSWINLQYYASVVDNHTFGAGNKTLHNVTGGIGVVEGSGGDLRSGLPMQSVHDGKSYQHLPNRLNVIVDAPVEAINAVLAKHEEVRSLFDNGWIYLFNLGKGGVMANKYKGKLTWKSMKERQYLTVES